MQFENFLEIAKHRMFHKDGKVNYFAPEAQEKFLRTVPFIFLPESKEREVDVQDESLENPLELPFATCFFEMLGAPMTLVSEQGSIIETAGLWIHEKGYKDYELLALMKFEGTTSIYFTGESKLQDHFLKIIKHLLGRIDREEMGFVNPRKSVKVKIGNEKRQHRIDKVVYVTPKKAKAQAESIAGRKVDWSHQWSVRGHWRVIEGKVGRDRTGNPVAGRTWVRSHLKGLETSPVIQKVRLVKT